MKKLVKILVGLVVTLVAIQTVAFFIARRLRSRYLSEEANEDMVNAVGVMDGWEGAVTSKSFQGGNVRAVMGGVELDLTDVVIENRPAIIQATIVMGGVLVRVPIDWKVEIEASQTMCGVEDDREHPAFDDDVIPDLVIAGKVIMGGLQITS